VERGCVKREISSGHSALLRETKGWRTRYVCRLIGHIPVFGDHRACGKPVGESASPRLDAGRRMEQGEKRSQVSSVSTQGQSPEEGGSANRPWKRVRSSLAMFLTA
jgi:hypothetical protein